MMPSTDYFSCPASAKSGLRGAPVVTAQGAPSQPNRSHHG
jgi:hypothetical protein